MTTGGERWELRIEKWELRGSYSGDAYDPPSALRLQPTAYSLPAASPLKNSILNRDSPPRTILFNSS